MTDEVSMNKVNNTKKIVVNSKTKIITNDIQDILTWKSEKHHLGT